MNNNFTSKNGFKHLYDPKEEGLGSYDVHYINANKNKYKLRSKKNKNSIDRCAA